MTKLADKDLEGGEASDLEDTPKGLEITIDDTRETLKTLMINHYKDYGEYTDEWRWTKRKLTDKVISQHLKGERTIMVPEMDCDSKTRFGVIDIDGTDHDTKSLDTHIARLEKVLSHEARRELRDAIRFVDTGNGKHMFLFLRRKTPAGFVTKYLLKPLLREAGYNVKGDKWFDGENQLGEIFPRKEQADTDGPGYGVRLPLGRHSNGNMSMVLFNESLESVVPLPIDPKLLRAFESHIVDNEEKRFDEIPNWTPPEGKQPLPACVQTLIARKSVHEGTHMNNLDLVHALLVSGYNIGDIHSIFSRYKGYRYATTQYQTGYTFERVRKGVLPPVIYKCETYTNQSHGLSCVADVLNCPRVREEVDNTPISNLVVDSIYSIYIERVKNKNRSSTNPLIRFHDTFDEHFCLEKEDHDFIDVVLAVTLDRDIPGDPVWLEVIGPSGSFKSEILRAVSAYHRCYSLDVLTGNTFISGKLIDGKPSGLLQVLDGKVLILKDFGTILQMPDVTRNEIFGQLRSIYDGYYEKATGNYPRKTRVDAMLGLILGATPKIDIYQKLQTELGERFLKIRQHPDSEKVTKRAFSNLGKEGTIRRSMRGAVKAFLTNLSFDNIPTLSKEQGKVIIKLSLYIALMRAWVYTRQNRQGEIYEIQVAEPEIPGRVAKQLRKLAIGLALIRG
ncbi:MAG: hypothetical protein ACE5IO_08840, partial [Thermoplasmata archaeon]